MSEEVKQKRKSRNNPNKVNQYTDPDPRQALFLTNYFDPKSETFGNVVKSGIKAGYEETYAANIFVEMPKWLLTYLDRSPYDRMLLKAEKVLEETMEMSVNTIEYKTTGKGKDKKTESIVTTNPALVKIKQDSSKFVAERIGKHRWAQRTEHTGPGGKDLMPEKEVQDKIDSAIDKILNVGNKTNTK